MSAGDRSRRQRPSPRRSQPPSIVAYNRDRFSSAEAALLVAARAQGCTCEPDITIDSDGTATARHDDWCALLRREDVN